MNILLAPDSFKGCLTSLEVCASLAEGINKYSDKINIMQFPSSDGGEGFCDCMKGIYGGEVVEREVTFPLGDRGNARFLFDSKNKTAFLELASASGLSLVPEAKRNILISSTFGTGELIKEAIALGTRRIVIGLGGSATNDCGMGMLAALGMRFFDAKGELLKPIVTSMPMVASVDKSMMCDFSEVELIAACDVKNPLCGKDGAAEVFSRQKGASEQEVRFLDKAAFHFASVLNINRYAEGAGAAGGVGAAVLSLLGGRYVSGASLLVESAEFQKALSVSDILITGEGNTDAQTAFGKLVSVVLSAAKSRSVRTIIVSGGLSDGFEELYSLGAEMIVSLTDAEHNVEYCIAHAKEMLSNKIYSVLRSL